MPLSTRKEQVKAIHVSFVPAPHERGEGRSFADENERGVCAQRDGALIFQARLRARAKGVERCGSACVGRDVPLTSMWRLRWVKLQALPVHVQGHVHVI